MLELLLAVSLVTVLSFLLSLTETAFIAIPLYKARMLSVSTPGGKALLHLKEASEEPITTIISLSNIVTVVGSVWTGAVAADLFGEHWVFLFAMILTFVLMVLGEIIPKRLAERYMQPIALQSAPFVLVISKLFYPLTFVVSRVIRPFLGKKENMTSREDILAMAEIGSAEGALKDSERKMIKRVFKLQNITASDMMTPRAFVFMLDGKRTLGEAANDIMGCPYAHIPIYEKSPDKIAGVATQRKLLKAIASGEQGLQVKDLADDPLMVPEGRLGDDLLKDFRENHRTFGIVVDGHGHISGVVSLDDIAEELVGEIAAIDEVAPEILKRISKTEIIAHGETQIWRINRFFNTTIPNHRTLCGYLLDEIGHMPRQDSVYTFGELEFRIESVDHSLIERVRISKK